MAKIVLILHGWGISGKKYSVLKKILEKNGYRVFAPDFPGFGLEPLKKPVMTIDDYVAFLHDFYKKHKISQAYVVAHSFGGRVIAKFAIKYPEKIEKIVFTGSPLIRPKLNFKKQIVQSVAHIGKKGMQFLPKSIYRRLQWVVYRGIGEWDYYKADMLRETFKHVINENAEEYIGKIKKPALILWGKRDKMVPEYVGKQISLAIPHATYESIADGGHAIPYSHPKEFSQHVLSFFER